MAPTIEEKKKLLNRVRRIMRQVAESKEVATLPRLRFAPDITRYRTEINISAFLGMLSGTRFLLLYKLGLERGQLAGR